MSNLDRAIYAFRRHAIMWLIDARTGEFQPCSHAEYEHLTIVQLQHLYVRLDYASAVSMSRAIRERS